MKWIIPALSVICVGAAQAQEAVDHTVDTKSSAPEASDPAWRAEMPDMHNQRTFAADGQQTCRDVLQDVRGGAVLPLLRGSATEQDNPATLMIYAVDYDISGCDFLLAERNGEIREVPQYSMQDEEFSPAQ